MEMRGVECIDMSRGEENRKAMGQGGQFGSGKEVGLAAVAATKS